MQDGITIESRFLEHLLNCLSDQKRIEEIPRNDRDRYQIVIDTAWRQGMSILQHHKEKKLSPKNEETHSFSRLEQPELLEDDDVFSIM